MRLSDVLSRAPETSATQVENFLGFRRMKWGTPKSIAAGKVLRNYRCYECGEIRTFVSAEKLSCLVTDESSVSIDMCLRCSGCEASVEAWFLVGCVNDMFSQAPIVFLRRYTENRREVAGARGDGTGRIEDLLERAQIAFDDHLGAGAMIYLRKVFEMTTVQAAELVDIPTKTRNKKRKPFRDLLQEVNELSRIIPREFSNDGYRLFSELSEVIHGDSDEVEALEKYMPCRRLLMGIIDNIRNAQELEEAKAILGWTTLEMNESIEGTAK